MQEKSKRGEGWCNNVTPLSDVDLPAVTLLSSVVCFLFVGLNSNSNYKNTTGDRQTSE